MQGSGIETNQQEVEGYYIVRAIVSGVVDPDRIFARDTMSYCGILLDNKNTKPICRLHFNNQDNLRIEVFDAEKNGTKHSLGKVNDIHQYTETIMDTVRRYLAGKEVATDTASEER